MKAAMFNERRQWGDSLAATGLHEKLDVLSEGVWLLIIFLLPIYFNPWCHDSYYFVKALALVFLVCLLVGLVLAQWFLMPHAFKTWDLPDKIRRSPLQAAAVVLGLTWVISTAFSVMPSKSLWGNLSESAGFMPNMAWIIFFLVIACKVRCRAQLYRALYTLLISSGIVSLVGILQFILPAIMLQGDQFSGRVFSTDGNPLSLSGFLAMTLPITLALMIVNWYGWGSQPRSKLKFTALLVLSGLQLCCLVLAQYSITLLLFIIGVFAFFALVGVFLQRRTIVVMSIISILLVAVIAILLLGQVILTVKTSLPDESPGADVPVAGQVALPTLGVRMLGWKCAADVVIDSPEIPFTKDGVHWLRRFIGYGPETYVATSQLKFPTVLKSYYTFRSVGIAQPENHYLYLAVTMGVLGLLAFLGLLAVFFGMGLRLLSRAKDKGVIVLAAAFVASIAQYCAHICFNPSVVTPELVFWLVLGLMIALSKVYAGGANCDPGTAKADCADVTASGPGNLRKLMSALIIITFITVGSGLTLPLMLANMKEQSGFALWNKNRDLALASFQEATLIGPGQAGYYDILGYAAFSLARQERTAPGVKNTLLSISEVAGNAAIRLEPQMAVWRYNLADRQMYRIIDGSAAEKADILQLYQEADRLFPGNAVILNKWALALILTGDYTEAEQKLLESGRSDPAWVQTFFFRGLLKMHEGDLNQAGGLFVSPINYKLDEAGGLFGSPVESNLTNIGHFINFCGQVVPYGEIGAVRNVLAYYVKNKGDDWIGFALLGIADIYNGNTAASLDDFNKASLIVTDKDAAVLAAIIKGLLSPYQDFRDESGAIVSGLMERAAKGR